MVEVEAVINSRPFPFHEMTQVDVVELLTPSQILTQKTKQVLPLPGSFQSADAYCRQATVAYLTNKFWFRWRAEFLPSLQERHRWTETGRTCGRAMSFWSRQTHQGIAGPWAGTPRPSQAKKAKVLVNGRDLERPVHKLVTLVQQPLEAADDRRPCNSYVERASRRWCRDAAPAGGVETRPRLASSRRRLTPAAPQ